MNWKTVSIALIIVIVVVSATMIYKHKKSEKVEVIKSPAPPTK